MQAEFPVRPRPFPAGNLWRAVLVLLLAGVVAAAVVVGWAGAQPLRGDGFEYVDIGTGLASGKGFVSPHGLWPAQPHTRPPLWPAILSVPLLLFPSADPIFVGRCTEVVMIAGAAAGLFALTWMLSGNLFLASLSGAALVLYPVSLALMVDVYAEPAAVFALTTGICLILRGGRLVYAGAAVLGLAPLARPNFGVLPLAFAIAAVVVVRRFGVWRHILNRRSVAACALFFAPLSAWVAHNYVVLGRFPVISAAVEGETLYGCYNTLTANSLDYWGYWVAPELLPGEELKPVLAGRMASELELNDYYRNKGMAFIRNNWPLLPRMVVGRLNRAFVPIPWQPKGPSYVAFFFRAVLDLAFLISLRAALPAMPPLYKIAWLAVFLTVLLTTVLYWGNFRLVYPAEVLMLPFIAVAIAGKRRGTGYGDPGADGTRMRAVA